MDITIAGSIKARSKLTRLI